MSIFSQSDYITSVSQATESADLYYNQAGVETGLTDEQWDALVESIQDYENDFPEHKIEHSLFSAVAAGTSSGGDVVHSSPMLSLNKAKTTEELNRFLSTVQGVTDVEPKIDGFAIMVRYSQGQVVLAASRGNGLSGEDYTQKVLRQNIAGLPARVNLVDDFEVRGEVYMTRSDYVIASANRVSAGEGAFANIRNAASGVIRRDTVTYEAPLSFAAYDVMGFESTSHNERLDALSALGFTTARDLMRPLLEENTTVQDKVDHFGALRENLDFPTDGIVIKADSDAERARLGVGSKHPKWGIAYKYADELLPSTIREIIFSIGRTGRLGIRGRIDPVRIDDSDIEFCSLHNVSWVLNKDVRIGDRVLMKKANGIIPQVQEVDVNARPENSAPWTAPQVCPQCGGEFDKSTLLWRCQTPSCSVLGTIVYATSRDALDIEGMSVAAATALVESGRVSDVSDLFTLSESELAELPMGRSKKDGSPVLLGQKTAAKVYENIQAAKAAPFNRIITALGLRMTGRGISRRLAARYHTMDALRAASVESLRGTDAVDDKAVTIHAEILRMSNVIDRLAVIGVNMGAEPEETGQTSTTSNILSGKKVCVTGSVPGMTRTEAQEALALLGAVPSSSVSKNTDFLVAGEGAGSKAEKAKALGVALMSAEEFASLVASMK